MKKTKAAAGSPGRRESGGSGFRKPANPFITRAGFQSLNGSDFKANYFEAETGDKYWISGCKKMALTASTAGQ
jgi:hypothetical protein